MLQTMKRPAGKRLAAAGGTAAAAAVALTGSFLGLAAPATAGETHPDATATPIKHVVVIFGENVSFDHYFATYPKAANTPGETQQGTGTPAACLHRCKNTPKGHQHPGERGPAGTEQPQLGPARPALPHAGRHLRPGPQLRRRAEGLQRRGDGQVRPVHQPGRLRHQPVRPPGPDHGLLRRQHRHRHLELRPELRHERQPLQHRLRPLHPRRAEPGLRPDPRRHRNTPPPGSPSPRQPATTRSASPTPTASAPSSTTRTRSTTTAPTPATPTPTTSPA